MKISFAVHGTPGKSESWGISNDETYLKSFYDEANNAYEQTRFNIDFRVVEKEVCSYYHYLKLKNISNGIARSGGYFGMSIRFEGAYCMDISNLFKMMNQLYEQVVCKSIIKPNGSNAEYVFSSFKQCQEELENIKALATKALEQFKNDIREFPLNYSPKHSASIRKYNVADTGSESFRDVLFRDAEVFVSPEYPLLSSKMVSLDKENKEKSEQIKEQQGIITNQKGQINSLSETISEQGNTINRQNTIIGQQNSEISQKNQQIICLESKLETANQTIGVLHKENTELTKKLQEALRNNDMQEINKCISMLNSILEKKKSSVMMISSIDSEQKKLDGDINNARQAIHKMQKELKMIKSSGTTESTQSKGDGLKDDIPHPDFNWKIPASIIGLLTALTILYFLVFGYASSNKGVSQNDFEDFKRKTENNLNQLCDQIQKLTPQNTHVTNELGAKMYPKINSINIANTKPPLNIGQEYTLQALDAQNNVANCGGKFSCSDNAEIFEDDGTTCKLKVNDISKDSKVHVKYINGGNVLSYRDIDIQ